MINNHTRLALCLCALFSLWTTVAFGQDGDDCSNAINLATLSSPISASTTGFNADYATTCLIEGEADIVYYIDVPVGTAIRLSQTETDYFSVRELAWGGSCPGSEPLDCRYSSDGSSYVWANPTTETQRIWWVQSGFAGQTGNFDLAWEFVNLPDNNLCPNAIPIGCGQTITGSTLLASVDFVVCQGFSNIAPSVWYELEGTGGDITLDLCESNYDNRIAVFRGDNCSELICVVEDDDACPVVGLSASLTFASELGETYYILATGYNSNAGDFELSVDCETVFSNDLAVVDVLSPVDGCALGTNEPVTVTIENQGTQSQNQFNVSFRLNNGAVVSETVNQLIGPGAFINYTFNATADLTGQTNNDLEVSVALVGDVNSTNDMLMVDVENGAEFDGMVSAGITACRDEFVTFTASGGVAYQWSELNETSSVLSGLASGSADIYVTITNSIGCIDVDTTFLELYPDAPVPGLQYSSLAVCPGGTVTLTGSGAEGYLWSTGETTASIVVDGEGYYSVQGLSSDGCLSNPNGVFVFEENTPEVFNNAPNGICEGESAVLSIFSGGTYEWSTGETSSAISVSPTVTTTYGVTVTTTSNCVYALETTVVVLPEEAPGPVSNLLPMDGATNVPLPTPLSWGGATNAGLYELYIWPEGGTQPAAPNAVVNGLNYTVFGLQNGTTYNWRVRPISCLVGEFSAIQTFTVAFLPDLVVNNSSITLPATIFSGVEIEISWQVENQGLAATPNNASWSDHVYLSVDQEWSGDDLYLGSTNRPQGLATGTAYTNSGLFMLPPCLEGEFYAVVVTDAWNFVAEADNTNNAGVSFLTATVSLTDRPDLVINEVIPPGVAGILQEGESYTIGWDVINVGQDTTTCSSWYDQVFRSSDPIFNPQTAQLVGSTLIESEPLAPGDSYAGSLDFTLPLNVVDTVYFFVFIDNFDCEEECLFDDNNRERTDPLVIISTPRPDFVVEELDAPSSVSNRERVDIEWTYYNQGIPYDGLLTAVARINTSPTFSTQGPSFAFSTTDNFLTNNVKDFTAELQIPAHLNGDYYLHLEVNANNGIDEGNNFGADNRITVPLEIRSPDLTPDQAQLSSNTVAAGDDLLLTYALRNIGAGDLINAFVVDRIELRSIPDGPGTLIAENVQAETITAGTIGSNRNEQLQLPITTPPGDYFLVLETNANGAVAEEQSANNSVALSITVTAPLLSSLRPTAISAPGGAIFTGNNLSVDYQVTNTGDVALTDSWVDYLYISDSPVWDADAATLVRFQQQARTLAVNQTYEQSLAVTLPNNLPSGDYYFYLWTDATNHIFEADEADNILRSDVFSIVYQPPTVDVDLFPQSLLVPGVLESGQTANISWQTRNQGMTATATNEWTDALYLSTDDTFDSATDTPIATWSRFGGLAAGGINYNNRSFTIPADQEGTFFLILVVDAALQTQDQNRDNNAIVLSIGMNGEPIIVDVGPQPDLEPALNTSFTTPLIVGQPLTVSYDVNNNGPGALNANSWSEQLLLANNEDLSSGQYLLATQINSADLDQGEGVTVEQTGFIPSNVPAGNFFLGLRVDAGGAVAESNEVNNTTAISVEVQRPLPGDLVPSQVVGPPSGTSGELVELSWIVTNQGENPVQGYFQQGIYLSADATWSVDDASLEVVEGQLDLGINASTSFTHEVCLTDVPDGEFFFLVRADLLDNIIESDDLNNTAASTATISVTVPELLIGLPEITSLPLAKNLYYRLEVDTPEAGETILVSLFSDEQDAINELYIRKDSLPTRSNFDYTYDDPFSENQAILLSEVETGTYYVLAYGVVGSDPQEIELLAEIVPFSLQSIDATVGGNTGSVTVELNGTRFDPAMSARLEDPALGTIVAQQIYFINPAKVFATFDLTGRPLGVYDMVATSGDGTDESRLVDAFSIVTGYQPPNPALTFSCGDETEPFSPESFGEVDDSSPLILSPSYPPSARPCQIVPITLRFTNTGNVDIALPSIYILSIGGAPLSFAETSLDNDPQMSLQLDFQENEGPPDVLRPGASAFVTIYAKAIEELKFILQ